VGGLNAGSFIFETSREAIFQRPAKILLEVRRKQGNSKQWVKNQKKKHI